MASKQSPRQQKTVARVMHEFKHGELRANNGPKVKNSKQAIAIALHEAGASREESPDKNRQALQRAKMKERRGQTAEAAKEGKSAQDRTMTQATSKSGKRRGGTATSDMTRDRLYAEARRREIAGRSRMSKHELEQALHH